VRLRRRSKEAADGADAYITSLGLSAFYWRTVEVAVCAAHSGDPEKFALAMLHFDDEVLTGARGGANRIYLIQVLRGRLLLTFDHEPATEELLALSQRMRPRFQRLVRRFPAFEELDDEMICHVLRQAVEGKSGQSVITGPTFRRATLVP